MLGISKDHPFTMGKWSDEIKIKCLADMKNEARPLPSVFSVITWSYRGTHNGDGGLRGAERKAGVTEVD